MPDESLDLLIKIQSDVTQLKQTVSAMEDLKGKVQQSAGAHEEATHAVHKHSGAHRELHALIHAVSEESPLLGLALRAVFSPLGAVIMGVVLAMSAFKKAMEDAKEKAKELDVVAGALWTAQYEGARSAETAADAYAAALKGVAEAQDHIADKYTHDSAVLKAVIEQHKTILELMQKEEEAAAAGDKDKEAAVKNKYAAINRANDLAAQTSELDLKEKELFEYKQKLPALQDKADQAELNLERMKTKPREVVEADERIEKAGGAEKGEGILKNKLRETGLSFGEHIENFFGFNEARNARFAEERKQKVREEMDQFKKDLDARHEYEKKLAEAARVQAETVAKRTEAEKRIQNLGNETGTQREVLKEHQKTAFETDKFGEASGALGGAERAARKFSSGQKLNADEDTLMRSVGSMVAGQNVSSGTAAQMLQVAQNSQKVQEQFLEKILATMTRMSESGLKKFEAQLTQLNRRLQHLESGAVPVQ